VLQSLVLMQRFFRQWARVLQSLLLMLTWFRWRLSRLHAWAFDTRVTRVDAHVNADSGVDAR
jgi:hypothetical protein